MGFLKHKNAKTKTTEILLEYVFVLILVEVYGVASDRPQQLTIDLPHALVRCDFCQLQIVCDCVTFGVLVTF